MIRFLLVCLSLVITSGFSMAETCKEQFIRLMIFGNGDLKTSAKIESEVGGTVSKNEFHFVSPTHSMTKMTDPKGAWILFYDQAMYQSNDEGQNWSKVRDMDLAQNHKNNIANQKENATTVTNEVCGTEEFGGKTYSTAEAEFKTLKGFKTENHFKYWVDPETGFIAKSFYHMKAKGFENKTTQVLEPAPELALPKP